MANGNQILFESGATMNSGFVFGGGTTEVASTSITIKDGATLTNVYGGGFSGKVTGNTQVTVEGGSVTSIYAGGYQAPVDGKMCIRDSPHTSTIVVFFFFSNELINNPAARPIS